MTRSWQIGGEAAWIVTGQFVAVTGSAIGVRILTSYLSPTAYGQLALSMTVAMFCQQAIFGPMGNAVVRFFAPSQRACTLPIFFAAAKQLYLQALIAVAIIGGICYAAVNPFASSLGGLVLV